MDKMPDEVYVSKQWGGVIGFEPFAGAEKYVRAHLPKEVDVESLKQELIEEFCSEATIETLGHGSIIRATIDHLVALGVIKDKGL